jgi:hypothetical protein
MPGHLRNINAQVSCTMSQARKVLKDVQALDTAKDADRLIEDAGKMINEIREFVAMAKMAGFTVSGPLGTRHVQLGDHTEGSGLLDLIGNLFEGDNDAQGTSG